jgi:hypothetical protein
MWRRHILLAMLGLLVAYFTITRLQDLRVIYEVRLSLLALVKRGVTVFFLYIFYLSFVKDFASN